ncbi:MAG: ABC transporter permease subunit [Bryobacteraceae bacterium]|nr:ABC transporter permease subunit [Bryobacteraceae bacterium]MDW8380449.1 ABC transporter permease subunit/CPBP intramembrane protease [Bryobacterales bacterium]
MRLQIVRAIFLKEIRETLRDRRTLVFMIVLPLVLYPGMIIGMSKFQDSLDEQARERSCRLTIWGQPPADLIDLLKARNFAVSIEGSHPVSPDTPVFEPMPDEESQDADKKAEQIRSRVEVHPLTVAARPLVLERKTDLILALWPQTPDSGLRHAAILYDSVREDSRRGRSRLEAALETYRKGVVTGREKERGLPQGFFTAMDVKARDIAPKSRRSGFGIGIVLPFLLLAVSATAGFYRAVDTTAGEKERNTMQTLLCAPVRSLEIVAGKFGAIALITTAAAAANIVSLGLTFSVVTKSLGGGAVSLNGWQYLIVFLTLLPVTLLTSALFLAVGVFAKDFRDGQNLLTPVMMLAMMPAAITMLPGVEANVYTLMAPFVNVALLIKALLVGEAKADQVFITLISSAAYAVLALLFAARVFERESLLTGGKDTFRGLFGLDHRRREVTPSLAFASFCLVLLLIFYGQVLTKLSMEKLLLFVQYGLILAPTLLIVGALRLPLVETLSLRRPSLRSILAAFLIGLSSWTVGVAFLRLLPPPESLQKAMQQVLLLDQPNLPLAVVLFVVAVSPGICEELLFRGLIQNGFRRLGMWPAILAAALLFGLAHGSIYRLLPVTFLGVVIGYLAWRSQSVIPGMLAHAVNNASALMLVSHPALRQWTVKQQLQFLPLEWSAFGALVLAAGLWLARGAAPELEQTSPNPS